MRLKIKGKVGQQEILEFISSMLNSVEAAGVEEYQGVNFYFNCCKDGKSVHIVQDDGVPLNSISVSPAGVHRKTEIQDGKKLHSFVTGAGSDINLSGEFVFQEPLATMTDEELNALRANEQKAFDERMKTLREESERRDRARMEERQRKAEIESKCCAFIVEQYKIDAKDLHNIVLSRNWLVTRKGIEKYTNQDIGDVAYRIAMRPGKEDKTKRVFLFDASGNFVLHTDIPK